MKLMEMRDAELRNYGADEKITFSGIGRYDYIFIYIYSIYIYIQYIYIYIDSIYIYTYSCNWSNW